MTPQNETILPDRFRDDLSTGIIQMMNTPAKLPDGTPYTATVPVFVGYQIPHGYLLPEPESHCLFFYSLAGRSLWEREVQNPITYEGSDENYHGPDFRRFFEYICLWYSVNPHRVTNFWDGVKQQHEYLNLPMLPDEERYRFDRAPRGVILS